MDKNELLGYIYDYALEHLTEKPFIPGKTVIPATYPEVSPNDITTVGEVLTNFWFTEHKFANRFGNELKGISNQRYVQLVNSGSSANLIAMLATCSLTKKKQRFVVTCAAGFPTTIAPIYQAGKIPLYVDIDPKTLQPNYEQIEKAQKKYGDEIAGMIFAHALGFPFDEDVIREIMRDYENQFLISDACDALGAGYGKNWIDNPKESIPIGYLSDVVTYSFFPAHIITTGEGGAALTDDEGIYKKIQQLANWGRSCFCLPGQTNTCGQRFDWYELGDLPKGWDHKYVFDGLGYNLKMTEFQAALGYSQIHRLNQFINKRRSNYLYLYTHLPEQLSTLVLDPDEYCFSVPFGFPLFHYNIDSVIQQLESKKIATRRFFAGNIIRQPGYKNLPRLLLGDLDGADYVMNNMAWIGCHPSLTQEQLDYMVDILNGLEL